MIRLAIKKYDDNRTFTKKDQVILDNLSKDSVVEGESLKADVKEYAKEIIDSEHDEKEFADKDMNLSGFLTQLKKIIIYLEFFTFNFTI